MNSLMNNEYINIAISYISGSFISTFLLGVLTGWLIEWIFYNLFWKQSGNKKTIKNISETSTAKKPEKQSQIAEKKQIDQKNDLPKEESKEECVEIKLEDRSKKQTEESPKKDQNSASQNTEVNSKDEQQATEEEVEKRVENEIDASKNKHNESQKLATSKTEEAIPEKETREKKEKKQPITKDKKVSEPAKPDNLTELYGVGPSIAKHLKETGIDSFKQLSESNTDELMKKLIANGTKTINKDAVTSWAKQAKFADNGDFAGLKAFQDKLRNPQGSE